MRPFAARRCGRERTIELTGKVNETLVPKLNKLPGFKGYYLIEAGNGIFSSLDLFETPEQSVESTKVVERGSVTRSSRRWSPTGRFMSGRSSLRATAS